MQNLLLAALSVPDVFVHGYKYYAQHDLLASLLADVGPSQTYAQHTQVLLKTSCHILTWAYSNRTSKASSELYLSRPGHAFEFQPSRSRTQS
jgi:hypothetical protein